MIFNKRIMNYKKKYTSPLTDEIPIRPEINFCTSNQTVTMDATLFDELDNETLNW